MTVRSVAAAIALAAVSAAPAAFSMGSAPVVAQEIRTEKTTIRVVEVAGNLVHPWGLAFLPGGDMLVTERSGALRRVSAGGKVSPPIGGVPTVWASGQGGLLDVALAPDFADSRMVYLSFSESGDGGAGTAVARGRLEGDALVGTEVIWRQTPKVSGGRHFGARLVFAPDGRLFVTLGDRGHDDHAQRLDSTIGTVVRIEPDGSVPADNPFVGRKDALPEIWSYGHRNAQGATLHPATGQLWTVEHGARGGDEINTPQAGKNYGWPVITYGVAYSGLPIGQGSHKEGMEQPFHYWDPSIAPSGMAFYTADRIPEWTGDLFVGSLKFSQLVRLDLDAAGRIVSEERFLDEVGERVRAVRQGPDGNLYLLTDHDPGRLLRVEPADGQASR